MLEVTLVTDTGGAAQLVPLMISEKRFIVPVSVAAVSATFNVHTPLAF